MKTVATCSSLDEALLLRSLLADSGIESFVPEELTVTFRGQVGGFSVQVADADAEGATKVLAEAGQ